MSHRAFNACWSKYQELDFGNTQPHVNGIMVSRPLEEFRADFVLIGRRALRDGSSALIPLFNLAYAECEDQKICERRLKLYRGAFETQSAAIKSIVGRAFILTEPYALYPTPQYIRDAENQQVIDWAAMKRNSGRVVETGIRGNGGERYSRFYDGRGQL